MEEMDQVGKVRKYKVRLNAHGGQQIHGINYWEMFALVVKWMTIKLLRTMIIMNEGKSRQLDFVLVYSQVYIDGKIYMRLPKGFKAHMF